LLSEKEGNCIYFSSIGTATADRGEFEIKNNPVSTKIIQADVK